MTSRTDTAYKQSPKVYLPTVPRSTSTAELVELIQRSGGVIVEHMFTTDQVDRLNAELDPHMQKIPFLPSPADMHGARTKRLTTTVAISEAFRNEWLLDEKILEWADAMLLPTSDSYWMTGAQVVDIYPGQRPQRLHRDLDLYPVFSLLGRGAPEVFINCIVALTEFTEESGATRVIPGSNLWPDFQDRGSPEIAVPAVMKIGSALLTSGKLVHGGGANVTKDKIRRGLLFGFNSGFLVPEEAHPLIVSKKIAKALPLRAQALLGFRSFNNRSKGGGTLWWGGDFQELGEYLRL